MAELMGVSFASINRWENGQTKPALLAWKQIARAEVLGIGALSKDFSSYLTPNPSPTGRGESVLTVSEPTAEYETRSDSTPVLDFSTPAEIVRVVAEGERLAYGHLFNPTFATEISRIDPLPHQRIAVYDAMLPQPRLRFLLADDAGAGKTIMAGLYIREMLTRRLIQRVLILPPAGLVSNWEREMHTLFSLPFRVVAGSEARGASRLSNPFLGSDSDLLIISIDTLASERMFSRLRELDVHPYDLVIFDESHKLSADRQPDYAGASTGVRKTDRYKLAEALAGVRVDDDQWQLSWSARHLLLLTATPHMGKDYPYFCLWRLLEPEQLSTFDAFGAYPAEARKRHFIRRTKEEMVRFDGTPIYPKRVSDTLSYDLTQGTISEQRLYDETTAYIETYYNRARILNRSAARLAMSIFQRRLASSTYALLRSFERRIEKLADLISDIRAGKLSLDALQSMQRKLESLQDPLDEKTADEEDNPVEGGEETDAVEAQLMAGLVAVSLADLEAERIQVSRLLDLARQVYDQGQESKFERLRQILGDPEFQDEAGEGGQQPPEHPKMIVFTEHRDTLVFLVRRLEGIGYAGQVAQIHGGMSTQPDPTTGLSERDEQVEFFRRRVDQGGALFLVATDAAGEGINLQFCWLMINYDIPWNPARLEQRMGRVHRYKQNHDVLLLNLVSKDTREGRVLKVLLDKLEAIRHELGNDKVFDIIGQQFSSKPLTELIFEAVIEGKEEQTKREIERSLTSEQVKASLAAQTRKVEVSEVRAVLGALQSQREVAELKRMMPAYIRRFFQLVAPRLGMGVKGDIESAFSLDPCPASVQQAINTYPAEIQSRLTFERELAMPDLGREPHATYLHPGEPVFEAVMDLFLGQYDHLGLRGGTFLDGEATEPYIFYLARASVVRDTLTTSPPNRALLDPPLPLWERGVEMVDEQMTGLRRFADGRMEPAPAHLLLTLFPEDNPDLSEFGNLTGLSGDTAPAEAFLVQNVALSALEARRKEEETRLPSQVEQLRVSYNLRQAELFRQRRLLKEAVENDVPAAGTKLRECETELSNLDRQRREAELALYAAPERLRLGPVNFYAQALVLPVPPEDVERRRNDQTEQIALAEVRRREEAEGSVIEDVSNPQLKAGFDFKVLRADGSLRYIEVKGRSGQPAVTLEQNEWAQAANHPDRYWLYVVYNCDTAPVWYRVADPFGKLVAKQTGSVRINASEIIKAAE